MKSGQKTLFSILLGLTLSFGIGSAQAGSFVHIGQAGGLDAQVAFDGYEDINGQGEYHFPADKPVLYKVRLVNRGGSTVSNAQVQTSLHSDGHECEEKVTFPGSPLPGASVSPSHTISLSPGQSYEYEAQYAPPQTLCPVSAHLKLRLQYTQYGRTLSSNLISQTRVELSK